MKPSILFPLILAGLGVSSVYGNNKLKESTFTQVINDVKVISMADKSQKAASVHELFKLPDVIRTGPGSRAELVAEDKTITRIGANTIFSFDPATRTIDLEKGSLLFHSPKGKGGGTIKTGNATAAVLGTTIMVAATPDGGFKVIVLEGTAKIKLANGQTATLTAGQEVFVLPGSKLSPVITVRLDLLVPGSLLVQGFNSPLPSMDLINAAIDDQKHLIEIGKATDSGLIVGHIASIAGVQVVNPEIMPPNFVHDTVTPPALNEDMIVNAPTLDQSHVFPTPTEVQSPSFSGTFIGAFARNISFVEGSQTVDLTPYHSLPNFTFLANGNIDIQNSVHFTGNSESYGDLSLIASGTITMAPESSLTYSGSGFFIQSLGSMSFNAVTFQNYSGLMEVSSGGNLALQNTSVYGNGTIVSAQGTLSLNNSYLTGYGYGGERPSVNAVTTTGYGEVNVASGGSMNIENSSIEGNTVNITSRRGSIATTGEGSFYGNVLNVKAAQKIDINGTYLGFNTINMAAKTIILKNVNFSSYVNVYLQSKIGQLAANPNTGAAPVAGYVNFISNVNYGGDPAQYHVNPSSGTGIFIYPLGGKPPTQNTTGTVARASMKIK